MKNRRLVITAALIILASLAVWLINRNISTKTGANPTNLSLFTRSTNNQTASGDLSDVGESSPQDIEGAIVAQQKRFVAAHPWADLLPHFETHFSVYLDNLSEPISVTVVLNSKNATEFAAYQKESRDWLAAQKIPLDQIALNFRYKGQ